MKRYVAFALAWQLFSLPVSGAAQEPLQPDQVPYWIESTLISSDVPQRTLIYRAATGDMQSATVGSEAALKRLRTLKPGQAVRLRCRSLDSHQVVVYEIQKAGSGHGNWLKWVGLGFLAIAAVSLVAVLIVGAPTGLPSASPN